MFSTEKTPLLTISDSVGTLNMWKVAALAGFAGGLAEVVWVFLYGLVTSNATLVVAYEITHSIAPALAMTPYAPLFGFITHFALAAIIATGFTYTIWQPYLRHKSTLAILSTALLTLASIWAINFLLVLPNLNPTFINLMPYSITLASKLLFGLVMAWVFIKYANQ